MMDQLSEQRIRPEKSEDFINPYNDIIFRQISNPKLNKIKINLRINGDLKGSTFILQNNYQIKFYSWTSGKKPFFNIYFYIKILKSCEFSAFLICFIRFRINLSVTGEKSISYLKSNFKEYFTFTKTLKDFLLDFESKTVSFSLAWLYIYFNDKGNMYNLISESYSEIHDCSIMYSLMMYKKIIKDIDSFS